MLNKIVYIILVLILFILYIIYDLFINHKENLQNYGSKQNNIDAPVGYEYTANVILNLDDISSSNYDYTEISSTLQNFPYTPEEFKKDINSKLYTQEMIEKDLMYFNNGSNLLLQNYHNDMGLIQ